MFRGVGSSSEFAQHIMAKHWLFPCIKTNEAAISFSFHHFKLKSG